MLERFFKLKQNNTTVKTEVMAGLTTFFTMGYVIFVNPDLLATGAEITNPGSYQQVFNGVFFATCISAFIGTILMGLYAKLPFAQASGMGLNAFFAFTVMAGLGYSYNETLGIVFLSGLLFIAITIFGLREQIVKAIPHNVKMSISAGIGLFLAFLGFQSAGIVVGNDVTLVALIDFSQISNPEHYHSVMTACMSVVGLLLIAALHKMNVKGSILVGMTIITLVSIPLGLTTVDANLNFNLAPQFNDFMEISFMSFGEGLSSLLAGENMMENILTIVMLIISFSLVDMFDTIGALLGTAKKAGFLDKDGNMPGMKKALMCDAIATTTGAMLGTSTVTTYIESTAGIGEGGRTGLTSVVTAFMFLIALVAAPFVGIIPAAATAPALIFVGAMMMASVTDIHWDDMSAAVPAFFTVAMMPMTYSIANGIGFGLITHVIIQLFTGKYKEINIATVILALLFVYRFFTVAM